jgi:hypothetical protein
VAGSCSWNTWRHRTPERGVCRKGNPFNRAIFCGCNLNRDTEQAILDAGFRLEEIERFQVFVAGWPEVMSHMIQGVATA